MADSTHREGSDTHPIAASDSVMECAAVNDVTTHKTSRPAWLKQATGHYDVANSAALRLAEITEDPPG